MRPTCVRTLPSILAIVMSSLLTTPGTMYASRPVVNLLTRCTVLLGEIQDVLNYSQDTERLTYCGLSVSMVERGRG